MQVETIERLDIRLPSSTKNMLAKAAEINGSTLTALVLGAGIAPVLIRGHHQENTASRSEVLTLPKQKRAAPTKMQPFEFLGGYT